MFDPNESFDAVGSRATVFEAGQTVANRFRIQRFLRSGGMGEVYEARDLFVDEKIALKTLRLDLSDASSIERLKREMKLARTVTHSNVCRVFEVFFDEGVPFFTMEYVEGETLAQFIRSRGRLGVEEARPIVAQICAGIEAAHRAGVIHRDFKSSNVMLTREEQGSRRAVITDFGLARFSPAPVSPDSSAEGDFVVGTPAYMAPEQVEGARLTPASDVYAVGVVCFEMVTGRLPFEGETPRAIMMKRLSEVPPPPSRLAPRLPIQWDESILRCLERDPARRFQSAMELVKAIDTIETEEPTPARRLRRGRAPARLWSRKTSWGLALSVAALFVLAGVFHWIPAGWRDVRTRVGHESNSIAVLPFENLSGDSGFEYFSDGITEEIISSLSRIDDLLVVAWTSSFQLKGTSEDVRTISQRLGVSHLVSGSVRRDADRLRITARLVDASDGHQLWSRSFDRALTGVFEIQEEISQAVVIALQIELTPRAVTTLSKTRTENASAFDYYLRGRARAADRSAPGLLSSLELYRQAIDVDPDYAVAYAGLADSYNMLANRGVIPRDEAIASASEAAGRALAIDDSLAEAHISMASLKQRFEWDWSGADHHFERAVSLSPGSALAHHWYAGFLSNVGELERAIEEIELARRLDPLSPSVNAAMGGILNIARRPGAAIAQLNKAIELHPGYAPAYSLLGEAYDLMGGYDDAIRVREEAVRLSQRTFPGILAGLGFSYARAGRTQDAQAVLEELMERWEEEEFDASSIALVHQGLGQRDEMYVWLERAFQQRDSGLMRLAFHPYYDDLRSDPRFVELVKRLRLD
jgi:serine/threonine-protein kinase